MKLTADLRAAFIDKVVAVITLFVYGARYRHYASYLASRKKGDGFPTLVPQAIRYGNAIIGVSVAKTVLRLLAALPPHQGEKLFIRIMSLKKRRQELP